MHTFTKLHRIIIVIIFVILIVAAPPLLYLWWFSDAPVSVSADDWGAFGQYWSGTTGTLLSLLNIIVLVFLTYLAWTFEDRLQRHSLRVQQRISMNELMHGEFQNITRNLHSVFDITLMDAKRAVPELAHISSEVQAFTDMNGHLFPSAGQELQEPLLEQIRALSTALAAGNGIDYQSFINARDVFLTALRADIKAALHNDIQQAAA